MPTLYMWLVFLVFVTNISHKAECKCCPNGWIRFEDSCYYFTHSPGMTYIEAEHYCEQHHSHLVHVNDATENAFIKDHLRRLIPGNYWMGLTDEEIEGIWKWQDSGSNPEFTDWYTGQPNDYQHTEDCAHFMVDFDSQWNDIICNAAYLAVCEMETTGASEVIG